MILPHLGKLIEEYGYCFKKNNEEKLMNQDEENESNQDNNNILSDCNKDIFLSLFPPKIKQNKGIKILEALAASGLRSIRFAQEVGGINEIVANDLSERAVECIKENIRRNNVEHLIVPSLNDARYCYIIFKVYSLIFFKIYIF